MTILALHHGQTYYSTVLAITGAGNIMDVYSDGVTIDRTPALVNIVRLGDTFPSQATDKIFQANNDLEFEWILSDDESHVSSTHVSIGTVPGMRLFN